MDINDNDEGAIIDVGNPDTTSNAQPVGTFGTEIRLLDNGTGQVYAYVTAVEVTNPPRNQSVLDNANYNYSMQVVLTGLQSCLAGSSCSSEVSLTNGATFPLAEGTVFGNGNAPKTRIDYLAGQYTKICIRFDHAFPNPNNGKTEYCRSTKENVFDTGSPMPTTTATVGSNGFTAGVVRWRHRARTP
jgi:hypothetical protein